MERFYDGDQEKLFTEAHVVNPFAKAAVPAKVAKREHRRTVPNVEECEVSFSLQTILKSLFQHKVSFLRFAYLHYLRL